MGGGGIVVSSSIVIKFSVVIEFDKFSKKIAKTNSKTSFKNYVTAELLCHLLSHTIVWFEISKFLYFWTNLAEIWLREQILGADFESEVIFYIRSQYQIDIGHFLQFCLQKGTNTL